MGYHSPPPPFGKVMNPNELFYFRETKWFENIVEYPAHRFNQESIPD